MSNQSLKSVFSLLRKLDTAKISYNLDVIRDGYIMITVAVPGQRWEIELSEHNETEVEVFSSGGDIYGAEKLDELFDKFSD